MRIHTQQRDILMRIEALGLNDPASHHGLRGSFHENSKSEKRHPFHFGTDVIKLQFGWLGQERAANLRIQMLNNALSVSRLHRLTE
jgi:hypothetical protein